MQFLSLLAGSRAQVRVDQIGRLAELTEALNEARSALIEMRAQLEVAQKTLAEERARNEALSTKLESLERVNRPDPNEWGLEPGVGI